MSKFAKKWFIDNNVNISKWPNKSPDLKPNENLFLRAKNTSNGKEAV